MEGHQVENELDRQLKYFRETELDHIRKEATRLREVATDVTEAMNECENYLAALKNLQIEVQEKDEMHFTHEKRKLLLYKVF